jgi:hypothetical protein
MDHVDLIVRNDMDSVSSGQSPKIGFDIDAEP